MKASTSSNPLFPASSPATGSFNGLHPKSKFLAIPTSNDFLSSFGNPTRVEASIGKLYLSEGLDAAFAWMEKELLPVFRKQMQNKR